MTTKDTLIKLSKLSPNEEVCALVTESDFGVEGIQLCSNESQDKKHYFSINPIDYKLASQMGRIKAVFHSHVNDNPDFSPFDYQQSTGHNLEFWLYDIKTDSFKTLQPTKHKYSKYIGKEFIEGQMDCFSLVRDFYKHELGIDIPNFFSDRAKNFKQIQIEAKTNNYFLDLARQAYFTQVTHLENFDILFFSFDNRIHMGIFLAPDCILHQLRNKKSCIERLKDYRVNFLAAIRYGTNS